MYNLKNEDILESDKHQFQEWMKNSSVIENRYTGIFNSVCSTAYLIWRMNEYRIVILFSIFPHICYYFIPKTGKKEYLSQNPISH